MTQDEAMQLQQGDMVMVDAPGYTRAGPHPVECVGSEGTVLVWIGLDGCPGASALDTFRPEQVRPVELK